MEPMTQESCGASDQMRSSQCFNPKDMGKPDHYDTEPGMFHNWNELFVSYMLSTDRKWGLVLIKRPDSIELSFQTYRLINHKGKKRHKDEHRDEEGRLAQAQNGRRKETQRYLEEVEEAKLKDDRSGR